MEPVVSMLPGAPDAFFISCTESTSKERAARYVNIFIRNRTEEEA
jgi:hypothetical protein